MVSVTVLHLISFVMWYCVVLECSGVKDLAMIAGDVWPGYVCHVVTRYCDYRGDSAPIGCGVWCIEWKRRLCLDHGDRVLVTFSYYLHTYVTPIRLAFVGL